MRPAPSRCSTPSSRPAANFIDTADGYSAWEPGHTGGESETIIGNWVRPRGNRDDVVIASKVSTHPQFAGLAADNIRAAADASLARLRTDHIDLYYAHFDDESVPLEETIGALSRARRCRQGALHRNLELHARAHRRVVRRDRGERIPPRRRPAAALQPGRARLRARPARACGAREPRGLPLLRVGQRVSSPASTAMCRMPLEVGTATREPARRRRPAPTSTSAVAGCSRALDAVAAAHAVIRRQRLVGLAPPAADRRCTDRQRAHRRAAARPARVGRAAADRCRARLLTEASA